MLEYNFLLRLKKTLWEGQRHFSFENLRWPWNCSHNFLALAESWILTNWLQFRNKKWASPNSFKVLTKGGFNKLYCCHGNLYYQENDLYHCWHKLQGFYKFPGTILSLCLLYMEVSLLCELGIMCKVRVKYWLSYLKKVNCLECVSNRCLVSNWCVHLLTDCTKSSLGQHAVVKHFF